MTTVRVITEHNAKSVRELRIRRLPGVSVFEGPVRASLALGLAARRLQRTPRTRGRGCVKRAAKRDRIGRCPERLRNEYRRCAGRLSEDT
jgi:hypothetical protein